MTKIRARAVDIRRGFALASVSSSSPTSCSRSSRDLRWPGFWLWSRDRWERRSRNSGNGGRLRPSPWTVLSGKECNMAWLDVTDQAILAATPEDVFAALVDEHNDRSAWWRPHLCAEHRSGGSYDTVGSLEDNTVAVHGRWPIKFTTQTVEARHDEFIRVAYVDGAFRGEGLWTIEPLGIATRLTYRWHVRPSGALRLLAPFLPIAKSHSETMSACFDGLGRYVAGVHQTPLSGS